MGIAAPMLIQGWVEMALDIDSNREGDLWAHSEVVIGHCLSRLT